MIKLVIELKVLNMLFPTAACCAVILNQQQEQNFHHQQQYANTVVNHERCPSSQNCTVVENGRVVVKPAQKKRTGGHPDTENFDSP
jgi:hypothetical protein